MTNEQLEKGKKLEYLIQELRNSKIPHKLEDDKKPFIWIGPTIGLSNSLYFLPKEDINSICSYILKTFRNRLKKSEEEFANL